MTAPRRGPAANLRGWRDRALTVLAVVTVLACTFGLGPFAPDVPSTQTVRSAGLVP